MRNTSTSWSKIVILTRVSRCKSTNAQNYTLFRKPCKYTLYIVKYISKRTSKRAENTQKTCIRGVNMCTFACVLRVKTRCFFIFDYFGREVFTKQHFKHKKRRPKSNPIQPRRGSATPIPVEEIWPRNDKKPSTNTGGLTGNHLNYRDLYFWTQAGLNF